MDDLPDDRDTPRRAVFNIAGSENTLPRAAPLILAPALPSPDLLPHPRIGHTILRRFQRTLAALLIFGFCLFPEQSVAQPVGSNSGAATPSPQERSEPADDIRDSAPPVKIPNYWRWAWLALGALILGGGALLLFRSFTRSPIPVAAVIPSHIRARERLLQALSRINEPREFCSEVSNALRDYLEERFAFHAPDRTTEEFLEELKFSPLLDATQKEHLTGFLQQCDLAKFARFEPPERDLRQLLETALRLVEQTASHPATPPFGQPRAQA